MLLGVGSMFFALIVLLVPFQPLHGQHMAVAEKANTADNTPLSKNANSIKVDFSAPATVYASDLTPIHMKITDEKSGVPLSHIDWAIVVKDPIGNVIYKTTTAHSHAGEMDFNVAFPMTGESTISLTTSSIGLKMMGMDVPGMARTHTILSGDLMNGWQKDPDNDFGTRTFEFPVNVLSEKQVRTLAGSEPGTSINVEMASMANEVVAGKPVTFVFTVTNGKDGSMVTHPDMQLGVRTGSFVASQSAPAGGMMAMNGAYHGHTGVMTLTTTFPRAGHYILNADFASLPVSNLIFGTANTRFDVDVSEGESVASQTSTAPSAPNTVNIIGTESPFFVPNTINAKAGTTIVFSNTDGNIHTVTSVKAGTTEPDGIFDSGMIKAGESFTYKFDKPGTYEYFCSIHTGMKGIVKVS
jgi:plastocyanin